MDILLEKVRKIINKEDLLKKEKIRRGEYFNIFEIMNAETNEVNTHSSILAELLNPNASHGCATSFLDLFLNRINNLLEDNILTFDRKNTKVHVEHSIGLISEDKETGGRLDLLIESNNHAIIIENKVYAGDQPKQLYRYRQYGDEKFGSGNYLLLYLTLDAHSPNKESINGSKGELEEGKDFLCISYKNFIREWLKDCMEKAYNKPLVRETIVQYYNLLSSLTYQNMEEKTKKELINLLATEDNFAIVFRIYNNFNEILNKIIQTELRKQVEEIATELNLKLDFRNINWSEQYSHFLLDKPEWNTGCICFEFLKNGFRDFKYGIHFKNKDTTEQNEKLRAKIQERIPGHSNMWWATLNCFKIRDWNNRGVYEKLYSGEIKKEMKANIDALIEATKDIVL